MECAALQLEETLVAAGAELARLREENQRLRDSLTQMEALAYRDPLTGLRNRRYLEERLQEELARLRRSGGELSVLLVDLDGFKQINDTRGHVAGDQALIWAGDFLQSEVRFTDLCCRSGGDEFVLLLPDTGAQGSEVLAAHLRQRLAEAALKGEAQVRFSLGCASARRGERAAELLARADAAMYREKRAHQRPRAQPPRAGADVIELRPAEERSVG